MRYLIEHINEYVTAPLVPAVLIICGIYITVRLRVLYITKLRVILRVLLTRKSTHGISPFRTVTVALAGTLGVGNILGVASAITSGGPGAIFWMWVGALVSMMIKYCEVVLAVKYRQGKAGSYFGGAMYYIRDRRVALLFAVLCVCASLTLGNLMQIRAISETFYNTFHVSKIICGALTAIIVFFIICRGFRQLSSVTMALIPFACIAYILLSLYVIIENICLIPSVLAGIFKSAFTFKAGVGGALGCTVVQAFRYGVSRGLITNEAGCGTAPMAHAESDTDSPVEQGFWGIFEVFADTLILCTASALVILISYGRLAHLEGMELVIASYSVSLGGMSGYVMSAFVLIFAISTIVGWAHYGKMSIAYLSGNKKTQKLYVLLYSFCCFLGVFISSDTVWSLTDTVIGAMTLINTFCIMSRFREVKELTDSYFR